MSMIARNEISNQRLPPVIPGQGIAIKEEKPFFLLCKPKLLPLKSITLEKLERMQNEAKERANIIINSKKESGLSSRGSRSARKWSSRRTWALAKVQNETFHSNCTFTWQPTAAIPRSEINFVLNKDYTIEGNLWWPRKWNENSFLKIVLYCSSSQ